ncbi:PMS1 [Hepatospora eriocheir]|uniref:PMS1 n=1 Tax=Hepatospora eriocheir TaxID=1081669 RepID=A0A1X0QA38_9MICR|nr:PMS1 [Hepatospora eriocheir]
MKVIGQFNQGFIICVLEKNERTNLVIVDQHAADKIYNFEKLRREFSFQRQMLIVPIEVELTESQSIIIETFKSSIEKNGFNIKGNFLHSVPFYKGKILGKNDFYNLLSNIEKDPEDLNVHYCDQFRKIMAEKACRESIMIGKALNTKQLEDIVRNLAYLDLPWKCPHGRPTFNILE